MFFCKPVTEEDDLRVESHGRDGREVERLAEGASPHSGESTSMVDGGAGKA